jgi:hypothetical protein
MLSGTSRHGIQRYNRSLREYKTEYTVGDVWVDTDAVDDGTCRVLMNSSNDKDQATQ